MGHRECIHVEEIAHAQLDKLVDDFVHEAHAASDQEAYRTILARAHVVIMLMELLLTKIPDLAVRNSLFHTSDLTILGVSAKDHFDPLVGRDVLHHILKILGEIDVLDLLDLVVILSLIHI